MSAEGAKRPEHLANTIAAARSEQAAEGAKRPGAMP